MDLSEGKGQKRSQASSRDGAVQIADVDEVPAVDEGADRKEEMSDEDNDDVEDSADDDDEEDFDYLVMEMMAAEWSDEHTKIVCELFAEQVEKENRSNTQLNNVDFSEVAKRFQERTGLEYKKLRFKNKWDKLKIEFTIWNKLRKRETGCGWDEVKKTIKMDDDWWKKAKEDIPGCTKFKKRGLQNEDLLIRMFAGIANDSRDHWSPAGGSMPTASLEASATINLDDNTKELEEEVEKVTPTNNKRGVNIVLDKGKRPKVRTTLVMQEQITRITDMASSFGENDVTCSIKNVMNLVIECGAAYGSNEHFIATELFVKRGQREMFITMLTPEIRYEWLKRKYNTKYEH